MYEGSQSSLMHDYVMMAANCTLLLLSIIIYQLPANTRTRLCRHVYPCMNKFAIIIIIIIAYDNNNNNNNNINNFYLFTYRIRKSVELVIRTNLCYVLFTACDTLSFQM